MKSRIFGELPPTHKQAGETLAQMPGRVNSVIPRTLTMLSALARGLGRGGARGARRGRVADPGLLERRDSRATPGPPCWRRAGTGFCARSLRNAQKPGLRMARVGLAGRRPLTERFAFDPVERPPRVASRRNRQIIQKHPELGCQLGVNLLSSTVTRKPRFIWGIRRFAVKQVSSKCQLSVHFSMGGIIRK